MNIDDPLSCLAELICVLIKMEKTSEAVDIFARVCYLLSFISVYVHVQAFIVWGG